MLTRNLVPRDFGHFTEIKRSLVCAQLSKLITLAKKRPLHNYLLLLVGLLALLTGCRHSDSIETKGVEECTHWLSNSHAEFFAIGTCGADTTLYLLNPTVSGDTLAQFDISNSFDRIATISTTHIPMLSEVGAIKKLVGGAYLDYVRDPEVLAMISRGEIANIMAADKLDYEQLIALRPEVLLVYPYGGESYERYEKAGIAVLPISEYAENHPLGRLEWIKVAGLITGNYARAERRFKAIRDAYLDVAQKAGTTKEKPLVFTGSFYKGRWTAPAGDSFVARLIEDAGGRYAFADYPGSENISLDFEVVLAQVADAQFFGKVLYSKKKITRVNFLEENARFALLNDFQNDQLFYCNTHQTDYFGRGLLEPHLMLQDLYHVFQHNTDSVEFHYFMPVEE